MEKYNIELLPIANDDLHDIFDFILLDNPAAATKMLEAIFTSIKHLENFPKAGVSLTQNSLKLYSFRMITINPYVVFYRLINDKVYIYRVLHGARNYTEILANNNQINNKEL
ncbi:type II toxin-antitoxin system RelE/ParE family toxin [Virgibacillus necropolis]|uniref:type II toxin-antitoxin system RelE/ParE family toxin n=1 Tax=Virgibacillus necropolis TaxID=163877 RepID=UPI0038514F55